MSTIDPAYEAANEAEGFQTQQNITILLAKATLAQADELRTANMLTLLEIGSLAAAQQSELMATVVRRLGVNP